MNFKFVRLVKPAGPFFDLQRHLEAERGQHKTSPDLRVLVLNKERSFLKESPVESSHQV